MKTKLLLILLIFSIFFAFSCGTNSVTPNGNNEIFTGIENKNVSNAKNTTFAKAENIETGTSSVENNAVGGSSSRECLKHDPKYHMCYLNYENIKPGLTDDVNEIIMTLSDDINASRNDICIVSNIYIIIKELNISKEDFIANNVNYTYDTIDGGEIYKPFYTNEHVEALYSDDMAKINEAFLNENFAVIKNGTIYDIEDIVKMDAKTFKELQLPPEQLLKVQETVEKNSTFKYQKEKFNDNLEQYDAFVEKKAELAKQNELRLEK